MKKTGLIELNKNYTIEYFDIIVKNHNEQNKKGKSKMFKNAKLIKNKVIE